MCDPPAGLPKYHIPSARHLLFYLLFISYFGEKYNKYLLFSLYTPIRKCYKIGIFTSYGGIRMATQYFTNGADTLQKREVFPAGTIPGSITAT